MLKLVLDNNEPIMALWGGPVLLIGNRPEGSEEQGSVCVCFVNAIWDYPSFESLFMNLVYLRILPVVNLLILFVALIFFSFCSSLVTGI